MAAPVVQSAVAFYRFGRLMRGVAARALTMIGHWVCTIRSVFENSA
jgi:hypothetical protein